MFNKNKSGFGLMFGRDRLFIILASFAAVAILGGSAIILSEPLFGWLLAAFLFLMVLGFSLTGGLKRRYFVLVLGIEMLIAGTVGGIMYQEDIVYTLSAERRAVQTVYNMLEACTHPVPERSDILAKPETRDRTTHVVAIASQVYNYGLWYVHADKRQIYPADSFAEELMMGDNGCKPLDPSD